ncbi:uncharacterized protein LOC131530624 isoform X2 [Onychostoma macrolepis]|uniref:Immunoglobulin domain-containing protein n=1 Tax=Onychostoma macrolepis TaxID=369639 RepID=A0A7J6BQG9_9TELE|nr:uncharacterized protein LOC131530624 isoform X2 [Onychostoma macrolepis]KAF4097259.1 hypothetical protein G5714_021267 [Onychostoma macrolepis]
MKDLGLIFLFPLLVNVVSGIETDVVVSVSVILGDAVTLQTEVTQIQSGVIEWRFRGHRIAIVDSDSNKRVQANVTEEFRHKLQLDNQTGDLKIRNIRTENIGLYKLDIYSARGSSEKTFNISGVASDGVKVMTVMERDSVVLPSGLSKIQRADQITWKFKGMLIAEIKQTAGIFSTYDVLDGRFRYRLHLNNQTGSLIITNVRPYVSGLYEINISKSSSRYTTHKTFNVTSIDGENRLSVMEGTSVMLQSGVSEIHRDDVIEWRSEHGDSIIAKIDGGTKNFTTLDGADGRYSDTLELDSQTGSLTIRHIRTKHAGLYHLDITGNRRTIFKRVFISVCPQNWSRYVMVIIVVAVLLLVVIGAAVVIRCRQTQNVNGSVI